jgi:hypothetical protein
MEQKPMLITAELADRIYTLAGKCRLILVKALESDIVNDTFALVDLLNLAMFSKIGLVRNEQLYTNSTTQEQLNMLKINTSSLIEKAIKVIGLNTNSSYLLGNSMYAAQISTSSLQSINETNKMALDNKLAIVDLGDCVNTLKRYYNMTDSTDLIILKTDVNSYLDLRNIEDPFKSNNVEIKVYDPGTRNELNMSICQNSNFNIKTPIKNVDKLNIPKYHEMSSGGIDIYNPQSEAFNSICFNHIDNDTQYDTTIGWRRNNYFQNKSATCSSTANCTYKNIDENNYVNCNCTNWTEDSQVGNDFIDFIFDVISAWNFQVVTCGNLISPVNIY